MLETSLQYSHKPIGNILEMNDLAQQTHYFNNSVIEPKGQYWYDALYRLTKATGRELNSLQLPTHTDFANNIAVPNTASNAMQNYTQTYQYDKLGNILQMKSGTQWTRNYVYDSGTNYLLKHDSEQTLNDYTYDAHGNILTMPHLTTMAWDTKDQLVGAGNGTFQSFYSYDNTGNRTRKVIVKGNVREERYYLGGFEVYRKTTNEILDVERKTILVSNDEKNIALLESDGTTETIRYQYDNLIGSSCLELDENANIITYEEYHPFGTTSYRSGINQTEVKRKRYRYVAKEHDDESGFYYYKHRYYAAWLARFISVDKLQHKFPELTPYQYASNCPIAMIDIDGLEGIRVTEKESQDLTIKTLKMTFGDDKGGFYFKDNKLTYSVDSNFAQNYSSEQKLIHEYFKEILVNSKTQTNVRAKQSNLYSTHGNEEVLLHVEKEKATTFFLLGKNYTLSETRGVKMSPIVESATPDRNEILFSKETFEKGTSVHVEGNVIVDVSPEYALFHEFGHAIINIIKNEFGSKFKDLDLNKLSPEEIMDWPIRLSNTLNQHLNKPLETGKGQHKRKEDQLPQNPVTPLIQRP